MTSKLYLYYLLIVLFFINHSSNFAQNTLVAELQGNPLNTTGWQIVSNGGGFVQGDQFILTQDSQNQQGGIFYGEAFNLNQCKKWRIEFEFRIWGNGDPTWRHGDGLAFWYLENPPQNFANGGTLGIPMGGRGIFVMMDTFDNLLGSSGQTPMSEVQLYYGEMTFNGNSYENDPNIDVNYINTIPFGVNIRNSNYQPMIIEWEDGNMVVTLAGVQIFSGVLPPHDNVDQIAAGYFGFSGATGAAHDQHSIRNVRVYMDLVELLTQNTSLEACDIDGDGLATFDLTSVEASLINQPQNYIIKYYANENNLLNEIPITNPSQFQSGNATIFVKVQNTEDCFDIAEIELIVDSLPAQNQIPTQFFCDENGDGTIEVDLTLLQALYVNGDLTDLNFNYFQDENLTLPIPPNQWNNYSISNFPSSVWIQFEKEFESGQFCASQAMEVVYDLGENLPINSPVFNYNSTPICIAPNANATIDLTILQPSFTSESGVNYQYYITQQQAEIGANDFISNPTNFLVTNSTSVFVRLTKNGFCFSVVRIDIQVEFEPEANEYVFIEKGCDEVEVSIDLDQEAIPLLVNDATGLNFTYHLTENDAQNHTNPQSNIINIPMGTTISIWVVISNGNCEIIAEVEIETSEAFQNLADQVPPLEVCDDDFDGIYGVNLTQVQNQFLPNATGVNFTYFTDSNLTNPIPQNQITNFPINSDTHIWIQFDNGSCQDVREFDVLIRDSLPINSGSFTLDGGCDENSMDLTQIQSQISFNSSYEYQYYPTQMDAINQNNELLNPEEFFPNSNNGTLYIRIHSDGFCDIIVPFDFSVNPLPVNPFSEIPTLCAGKSYTLDAGNQFPPENYFWTWGNGEEFVGPILTVNQPGTYRLKITSLEDCENEFEIIVPPSAQPIITKIEIGSNFLIVYAQGNGGYLEYSLNGVFWQDDPRFENLIPGEIYTVFVREDACDPTSKNTALLHIPNFISPNGDGYNDVWTIRGLEFYPSAHVKIFDRYGKLFVDRKVQSSQIWDGKYLGRPLPSGDYWYIITIQLDETTELKYTGNLSLRNRD